MTLQFAFVEFEIAVVDFYLFAFYVGDEKNCCSVTLVLKKLLQCDFFCPRSKFNLLNS